MHLSLQDWLHQSGLSEVSYHVLDAAGTVLASHEAAAPRAGASTTKLLTADAALRALGPDHRFRLEISHHGSALFLTGCHPWLQTADLLQLATTCPTEAPELFLDDSRYPPFVLPDSWSAEDLPLNVQPVAPINLREYFGHDPAGAASEAVAGLLTANGHPTRFTGRGRARGDVVGSVDSPPLLDLVVECLYSSHNLMAEILGRETALALGLPPEFASMQAAITEGLAADTTGMRLLDASGLSHLDRVRADVLTHVLHGWLDRFMFGRATLPLAGLTGTVSAVNDWFQNGPAADVRGYLQVKTGTHEDCVALAGYTFAPQRPVRVFAVLVDGLVDVSPHLEVRREVELFARLVALEPAGVGASHSGVGKF